MAKLAILIPSRNEEFLQKTVEDIFEHSEADTEVIIGLDGHVNSFSQKDLPADRLKILFRPVMGQRAMTNRLAKLTNAEYIMKVDAHRSFSKGFDVEMLKDMDKNTILAPRMMNLHAYDWNCPEHLRTYQGKKCCDKAEKVIVWQPKNKPLMSNYVFDSNMIFQYADEQKKEELTETMCLQGSAWMVSRETYWELDLSGEDFGSWGQQGVELGCKMWLSGGRVLTTNKADYAHLFRKEDEFPYQRDMKQVDHANTHCRELFLGNKWDKQTCSIQSLIEQFNYPCDWTKENVDKLCKPFRKDV